MLFVRVCQSLTDTTQWFYGTGFTTPSNEYVACDLGHRDRHCRCSAGCTAGERLDGWTAGRLRLAARWFSCSGRSNLTDLGASAAVPEPKA